MPVATLPGLVHACGHTARAGSCLSPRCPGWFMPVTTLPGLVHACHHTARAPNAVAVGRRQDEREGRRDDSYSLCCVYWQRRLNAAAVWR